MMGAIQTLRWCCHLAVWWLVFWVLGGPSTPGDLGFFLFMTVPAIMASYVVEIITDALVFWMIEEK